MERFEDLLQNDDFLHRHIGPTQHDAKEMLAEIGATSLDALIDEAVPESIRDRGLDLPGSRTEPSVIDELEAIASKNEVLTSMIGMGYYNTITPPVILRNVLEDPGWYTAYTPYQPEISQGRLEALLNFQTMVCDLTGTDISNASLLDEATAAAEAMTMCRRVSKHSSDVFFVDSDCHPQTIDVVETRAEPLGIKVLVGDPATDLTGIDPYAVLVQYPGSSGAVHDYGPLIQELHAAGVLVIVATDLLAMTILRPPGELGADVVVGSSQRFGVPLGFGGPHAAFIATRDEYKRSLPGRLVGVSVDTQGRTAYRLALQTREQHIRREKATSNICTSQVLLAVIAGFYACYHGSRGLTTIASRVHRLAAALADSLRGSGIELVSDSLFDTVTAVVPDADRVVANALRKGINLRLVDSRHVGVAVDETTTQRHISRVLDAFGAHERLSNRLDSVPSAIPEELRRSSDFLTHPVFSLYRSETEMLRYLRRLAGRDIALDRSMIPLGSCTMKLNATTEMLPVTWREFGSLHPFIPLDQAVGYIELIRDLEEMLAELTGYDAVSVQPNAGSQGEYAGLLAIRRYHESRHEAHRDVCLIPVSAHGTNPASATMAGLEVVLVACDDDGNVDVADLKAKLDDQGERVAALMVTDPSTHGVFDERIVEICELVHEAGGQVYLDGANLNAMVGIAKPGRFGADVSQLNLHKTFCIPHGGGGPGVGPIGVKDHLAPFLPGHTVVPEVGPSGSGAVSAAPWGSAGVLPISWAYLKLMGGGGLAEATRYAMLTANYVAARLDPHYPVLYRGTGGRVAHECIIDLRSIKAETGVSVDDVAKRLMDYGFHAPTVSFPVVGTMMIEPTESESKRELDRFCDALISIKAEIDRIGRGEIAYEDSPLYHAPHTAEAVAGEWGRAYSREEAAYPVGSLRGNKYWPPVGRIDARYGDTHVVCTCPPMEAYES